LTAVPARLKDANSASGRRGKRSLSTQLGAPAARRIADLRQGDEVIALTGVNLVLQPGKGGFTRDVPMFGAKIGDTLYTYQNCGEGAFDLWVSGRFIQCSDPNFSWKGGRGCQRDCNGRYLELGKSEWWAEIRLKNGGAGWVLVTDNFDGIDALA
jgi:hypothetical protein